MGREGSKNYYDLLGVLPSASMIELKRAFRDKAKSYHPDLNPDEESQAQFRDIQEAYNLLRDPVERTFYDRELGLKSNWVEEAHRDSQRKKADQANSQARSQADRAEAHTRKTKDSGAGGVKGDRPRTRSAESSRPAGATGRSGSTRQRASSTGERSSTSQKDTSRAKGDGAPRSRASAFRNAEGRSGRRNRRSSRFAPGGASRSTEPPKPSETYPPPPATKLPWYRDRPLRIFLFAGNLLAALAFFFTNPTRGVYFLVLAFGIEILYRLEDLKDRSLRPPSFRPPPKV